MARLVLKFGGSSLATTERIYNCVRHVKREYEKGHEIAVVVSACGDTTDDLIKKIDELISSERSEMKIFDSREFDTIVSSGEQKSAGLMAMALQNREIPARSWLGWQCPVATNGMHSRARVESINTDIIIEQFKSSRTVAVLAGFQGVSEKNRITTIGRGGSDTSAVLLAAALKADRCDIYTDVKGVYDADPKACQAAKVIKKITYEEMLELASSGAKVLHTRSLIAAIIHKVKLSVRSSFEFDDLEGADKDKEYCSGTLLVEDIDEMEKTDVTAIAHTTDEALITLVDVGDTPGIAQAIFLPLSEEGIDVDMIIQTVASQQGRTDVTFTVAERDLDRAKTSISKSKSKINYKKLVAQADIAKVSIVGIGMRSNSGVASRMFSALSSKGINIIAISTSEIKVSVVILQDYVELAIRALHAEFRENTNN